MVDFEGRLYLNLTEWDVINNTGIRTISRIADPFQPIIERLLVRPDGPLVYEMLFYNQKIYMVEAYQPYILVYDTDFNIIDTIITQKHIYGITAINHGCDSTTIYVGHSQYKTQDFWNTFDSTLYISTYDPETNTLTAVCNYWMGDHVTVPQLTSPLEFLASDPECDLLIDLDRDNSTGVFPYDYLDSNKYCGHIEVPVCDEDVYIRSSAPLDSLLVILSGIRDIGEEKLLMQVIPDAITVTSKNDSTYLITSSKPSDSLYSEALRAIVYQHSGIGQSPGARTVIFQGFNAIKSGIKVKAIIHIEGLSETFLDITTCKSAEAGTFIDTLLNQKGCDSIVTTTVSLVPPDSTYISIKTCDPSETGIDEITFTNKDGCDSIVIKTTSLFELPFFYADVSTDYHGYGVSCYGEADGRTTAVIFDTTVINLFLWSNGSTTRGLKNLPAGTYSVTITDKNGCTQEDEIVVTQPEPFTFNFMVTDPDCFTHMNGSIIAEQIGGIEPILYTLNGSGFQSSPIFNDLPGGTYKVSAIDANGCEAQEIIWLNVPLEVDVDLGDDQIISPGESTVLNALVNLPFDSLSNISWSGLNNPNCPNCLLQPVAPIVTTAYSVFISSNDGCFDADSMTVYLSNTKQAYVPNIFSPNGDGNNDVLLISGGPEIKEILSFEVFDRWGNLLYSAHHFQPNDVTKAWNGKRNGQPINPDVFAYKILVLFQDNSSSLKYGDITLLK